MKPRRAAAYRRLLRLLPRDFRERHGAEMEALFLEAIDGRSAAGRWTAWAAAVRDVATIAAKLRWATWRSRRFRGGAPDGARPGWGLRGMLQDLGFVVRSLRRRPGFALVAVVVLSVGIGGTTTVYTVVRGVLLRPLPYEAPERIGILWHDLGEGAQSLPALNPLDLYDYRAWSEVFEDFTLGVGDEDILGGPERPELVQVGFVEAGFFEFFGVEPLHGRRLVPEDDRPGASPVAILSHRLWRDRFGGDPGVVGRTVDLGGDAHQVVGVLPEGFSLHLPSEAFLLRDADVWTAARVDPAELPPRNYTAFTAFGRIRAGATFDDAQRDLDRMEARLRELHPVHAASSLQARVVPLHDDVVKGARPTLLLLFVSVGLVLIVSCANVGNLLLVRGRERESELAVRIALGAHPGRIIRLVLLESAVLAAAAAGLGVALTEGALGAVRVRAGISLPRMDALAVDWTVLTFTAGAGLLAALASGLPSALRAADAAPGAGMASRTRSRGGSRFRDALVLAEVAVSMVLLVGAGLTMRSVTALQGVDPGFEADGLLTFRVSLPDGGFPDHESEVLFRRTLEERLGALPGVEAVSATSQLPLTGSGPLMPYAYDAETATRWESVTADQRWVTPGFFRAVGGRLLAGREFTADDLRGGGSVIIVDERLAERAFPGVDPVGRRLQIRPDEAPEADRYAEIVGVVAHLRLHDLARPHLTQIYRPMDGDDRLSVLVRTSGEPASLAPSVRREVAALGSGVALQDVRPMEDLVSEALAPIRVTRTVIGLFAAVALAMAVLGLYGVLAFAVRQRAREIGIRLALGQRPSHVRRMVVIQGMRLVLVALVLGGAGAWALWTFASSQLYGVDSADPATYLVTAGVLSTAAMLACWVPARRATRIDPAETLKTT